MSTESNELMVSVSLGSDSATVTYNTVAGDSAQQAAEGLWQACSASAGQTSFASRGYVWNRDQVRGLMHSLYRKHPVGSLLVWVTKTESANARGDGQLQPGTVKLLLDGQQRITSLY